MSLDGVPGLDQMLYAAVPASFDKLPVRACNEVVVSAHSDKLGRSFPVYALTNWQAYETPEGCTPGQGGWSHGMFHPMVARASWSPHLPHNDAVLCQPQLRRATSRSYSTNSQIQDSPQPTVEAAAERPLRRRDFDATQPTAVLGAAQGLAVAPAVVGVPVRQDACPVRLGEVARGWEPGSVLKPRSLCSHCHSVICCGGPCTSRM